MPTVEELEARLGEALLENHQLKQRLLSVRLNPGSGLLTSGLSGRGLPGEHLQDPTLFCALTAVLHKLAGSEAVAIGVEDLEAARALKVHFERDIYSRQWLIRATGGSR